MIDPGPAKGAYGVMFHRFRAPGADEGWQGALTADEFGRILEAEIVAGARFLSPDDWMERLAAGRLEAPDRCVTFDDGLACQAEIALPVLDAKGLKAFWFVSSGPLDGLPVRSEVWAWAASQLGGMTAFITAVLARLPPALTSKLADPQFAAYAATLQPVAPFYTMEDLQFRFLRNHPHYGPALSDAADAVLADAGLPIDEVARALWMTAEQWRALADDGHHVGLHSHTHPYDMARLSADEQRQDYSTNAAHIRRATGRVPTSMAHPLNAYSAETLQVLRELGITCGFCAHRLSPWVTPTALTLPREDPAAVVARTRHDQ